MKLFHGTNHDIESIDLTVGQKYKDFGQGFYLTPDMDTAERMAVKKSRLFGGTPVVIVYEFDSVGAALSDLNIKEFPEKATSEWIRFIDRNRDKAKAISHHGYDVVIGPIADDGVVLQLTNFRNEIVTPEEAASRLQDKYLDQQYYFGSDKSLSFLKKIDVWQIS